MTATLTSVSVAGETVSVASAMTKEMGSGVSMPVKVVLAADSGTIIAGGKAVSSGSAFKFNFNNSPVMDISVKDGDVTNTYTLAVTVASDDAQATKMSTIRNVGWFAARYFEGDLDTYKAGGIVIPMGGFTPRYAISVQITGGFTGYFDVAQKKLMVYSAPGTEATASALSKAHYQMILMS